MKTFKEMRTNEALSLKARKKRAITMKRIQGKLRRGRERQAKRNPTQDVWLKRAKKAAHVVLKQKVAGKSTNLSVMTPGQKRALDIKVKKRFGAKMPAKIARLAKKLLPKIRKAGIAKRNAAKNKDSE